MPSASLDFPHAVEYLTKAAQRTGYQGAPATDSWIERQAHILKHDEHGAAKVLVALARLPTERSVDPVAARQARDAALNYLTKTAEPDSERQLPSARPSDRQRERGKRQQAGGRGALKGSGMHWARAHVNPLVGLRTIACSDRWAEAWPRICASPARLNATTTPPAQRHPACDADCSLLKPEHTHTCHSTRRTRFHLTSSALTAFGCQWSANRQSSMEEATAAQWRPAKLLRLTQIVTGTHFSACGVSRT